jgi:hypothetical protein
MFKLL